MSENYIDRFILRLDFLSPIDVADKLEPDIIKGIAQYFRKASPKKLIGITSDGQQVGGQQIQWSFAANDQEKFTITPNSMILSLENHTYISYERSVVDKIYKVLQMVFLHYSPQLRRIGLRYVNVIPIEKVKNNLLYYKNFDSDYNVISSTSTSELKTTVENYDIHLRIQQGKPNEKENEAYLLVLDGSTSDTVYDYSETIDIFEKIRTQIKKYLNEVVT